MAVIRPAEPADIPALQRIEKASFPNAHWQAASFLVYDCRVAEIEGEIAGFVVFRTVFRGDGRTPSELEILNLAVDPAYRRRGVASTLLRSVLRAPSTRFYLEVRESNSPARQLYEKLGFIEVARRTGYYSDPTETAIVMGLK